MFKYAKDDSLTRFEKIIVTLYEAGAMAQSDMAKVFEWSDYTLSRAIAAANGESKKELKIGSIVEQPGVKNSGKIRYLTRSGLEVAASMLGVEPPPKNRMLNEAELRIAAQMAKFATAYRAWAESEFHGPYKVMNMYRLSVDITKKEAIHKTTTFTVSAPWPFSAITIIDDDVFLFVTYITPAMRSEGVVQRIKQWDKILSHLSKIVLNGDLNDDHSVLFLAPTENLVAGVPKLATQHSKHFAHEYAFASFERLDERVANEIMGQYNPS